MSSSNKWETKKTSGVARNAAGGSLRRRARELFDLLLKQVKAFGPVRTDAVKSAINLTHQSHFAMVYVRKASLTIDLASEAPLMSDRVFRSEQLGPRLHLNYVILSEPEDIDNELLNWLRDAYDRAG